jgi:hypothetical protein
MEAAAELRGGRDGWLISHLRRRPRRRLEDKLLDRKLRHLDVDGLVDNLDRLEAEVVVLREQLNATDARPPGHVLFLPTPAGYAIVEAAEPPPPIDQLILLDAGCFRVQRVGRSPFPGDRRPCLFLELAPAA